MLSGASSSTPPTTLFTTSNLTAFCDVKNVGSLYSHSTYSTSGYSGRLLSADAGAPFRYTSKKALM